MPALQPRQQAPRKRELEVLNLAAVLAHEVVVGRGVAIVTRDPLAGWHRFDLALRHEDIEVAIDRPQGKPGEIHTQRSVKRCRGGMAIGRAQELEQAFQVCDLVVSPTTPTTAFKLGAKVDDPIAMYLNDIYTIPANLSGLPGISIPAGFDNAGHPVGLQLIGRYFDEARLLNMAHHYQRVTDWHKQTPAGFA